MREPDTTGAGQRVAGPYPGTDALAETGAGLAIPTFSLPVLGARGQRRRRA